VISYPSGYAPCERVLLRIELRPGGGDSLQKVGSIKTPRPSELSVGRVLSADAKDVSHQRAGRRPLLRSRYTKSANLLAYAFEDAHDGRQPLDARERRAYPRMLVNHVKQAQCDGADRCLRCRDDDLVDCALDYAVASGSQQVTLIGNVPVNRAGACREPFGQRVERQTLFSAAVQQLD
jgi:hypothetical protein